MAIPSCRGRIRLSTDAGDPPGCRGPDLPVPRRPHRGGQDRCGIGFRRIAGGGAASGDHQRRFGTGLSWHGYRFGQAEHGRALAGAAPSDRPDRADPALFGSAVHHRRPALHRRRSPVAAICRCWSVAPCFISRPCSMVSTRCRPATRRSGWKSIAKRPVWAGRRCTPSWPESIRSPPPGCRPPTVSASNARSKCGGSAAGRWPSSTGAAQVPGSNAPARR